MTSLINGDCLDVLQTIPTNTVDLVICDLPYGQTDCEWDTKIDLAKLWTELKRVIKQRAPLFFFCTTKFGYELIKSNEKWFRYDLVWYKPNSRTGFLQAKRMPMRSHEMLYVFYEKLPTYDIESHHTKIQELIYNNLSLGTALYGTRKNLVNKGGACWEPKLPHSVLEFGVTNKSKQTKLHNTQKPIELLKWIIKYYSKTGDTVLDPTMGSGSTGVAAIELNRKFIGIEKDETIYQVAQTRLIAEGTVGTVEDTTSSTEADDNNETNDGTN